MTYVKSALSDTEALLYKATNVLDYSLKTLGKLDESLIEAHESWKKAQDGLPEMRAEHLDLSEKYVKLVEHIYSILQDYFKNSLREMKFFYL